MKLKTSNKLLLGYVASLLMLIAAFIVFGFTNVKNLPEGRFTANVEYKNEAMDEFKVLHISGNSSLHIDKGDAFEIVSTTYPNDTLQISIGYHVRNDTCFVTQWERTGMNYTVMKVATIETVIVENSSRLYLGDFKQNNLTVFLDSGKLETSQKKFSVDHMELTASGGANARIYGGIRNLNVDAEGSQIYVYEYLESVSGAIKHDSRLELHKSVGKLDFEKSSDSRFNIY